MIRPTTQCVVSAITTLELLLANAAVLAAPPISATSLTIADPRLRELTYDSRAIITIPVKRGVVTLVQLGEDEAIGEVATGLGSDCAKPESSWCIAAQPAGNTVFIKPKTAAQGTNNLTVVTDRRSHAFRLVLLADDDPRPPVYRLVVHAPAPVPSVAQSRPASPTPATDPPPAPPSPDILLAERLRSSPQVRNARYSLAEGSASADIVPTLVFDDGRFTYLRIPGNRGIPAVFELLGDGSEALVNTRMEGDLLVVDRVARRLMLRAGSAVIEIWNDAFDPDGVPAEDGTTAQGVARVLRTAPALSASTTNHREVSHD